MNLTLARLVGLAAALGAGLTAFTGAATSSGGYKAGIVAALSAVVLTWLHEEHSTERNATRAAASLRAPASSSSSGLPAEAEALLHGLEGLLPGHGNTSQAPQGTPAAPAQPAPPGA